MIKYKNDIRPHGKGYRAYCFNSTAAQLLNRRLKAYHPETNFEEEGSEGQFDFSKDELPYVKAVLEKFGGLE